MSGKSKSTHYKNLAQKVLVSEPEFQSLIIKNDRKAATHFGTSVKNQVVQLEKGFKEARENLGITDGGLLMKMHFGLKVKFGISRNKLNSLVPGIFA